MVIKSVTRSETNAQRAANKLDIWAKINAFPFVRGCWRGDPQFVRAMFGGFWNFVNGFPQIIRDTYSSVPAGIDEKTRRFLERSAQLLAGMLAGMESDERAHRALWLRAARQAGLEERDLEGWELLPEVRQIAETIGNEKDLYIRLLYFVSVELIAEGLSRALADSPEFLKLMGTRGMAWFKAHLVHEHGATTHEQLAYNLAGRIAHFQGRQSSEESMHEIVINGLLLFARAANACGERFIDSRHYTAVLA
jgi:pyrroloquinoline quinone (PQQ) biosynthesis protein C